MKIVLVFAGPVDSYGRFKERTEKRLEKALELYNDRRVDFIFATGGQNIHMVDGSSSASEAMRNWFKEKGVDEKSLSYTDKSVDTFGNITDAMPYIIQMNPKAMVLISDKEHLRRIKLIVEVYCKTHGYSCDFTYVPSDFRPPLFIKKVEYILYLLTKMNPLGQGLIWSALRRYRRKKRGIG